MREYTHTQTYMQPYMQFMIHQTHITHSGKSEKGSDLSSRANPTKHFKYQVKTTHDYRDRQVGCCLLKEVSELLSMCNFMAKYKQKNPSIIINTAVEPNSPNDAIAIYIDTHIYSNSQFEVLNSQHPSLSFLPIL